jgi:hypothetical protein
MATHGIDHWDPDGCFGCRVKTVGFAPSIFTTTPGGAKAAENRVREGQLVKDLDAFKRMRLAGEEPPRTRGAARIESECESSYEIKTAQPAHKMAKGPDAGKPISQRGKEWRRRANEADQAVQRGEVIHA